MLGNILLAIVSVCTMISYVPQIIKLVKTKKSEDISIKSWSLWVVSGTAYAIYAVFCNYDFMLMILSLLELFFCLTILLLTVKYRNNKGGSRE